MVSRSLGSRIFSSHAELQCNLNGVYARATTSQLEIQSKTDTTSQRKIEVRRRERKCAQPTSYLLSGGADCLLVLALILASLSSSIAQMMIRTDARPHPPRQAQFYSASPSLAGGHYSRSGGQSVPSPMLIGASSKNTFRPPSTQVDDTEARGALSRNLYGGAASSLIRSARNGSSPVSSGLGSWHFPRISPEQAAEVLLTGAQVINRIAQADTPLNYCKTPDNQEGECSDIRKCIWLVLDKARLKQSVCLRNLIIPAVCCPISAANNTPMANMIQSTLEPVLFRPKAPKQRKQFQHNQLIQGPNMRPFMSIVNRTIIGSPPPSPVSLIIRNPTNSSASSSSTTTTTTTTAASSTSAATITVAPPVVDSQKLLLSEKPTLVDSFIVTSSSSSGLAPSDIGPIHGQPSTNSQTLFQSSGETSVPTAANSGAQAEQQASFANRTISHRYPWANETCGEGGRTRTSRIVGGSDSKLGQWPWMTAMYLNKRSSGGFSSASASSSALGGGQSGSGEFWCGGALINRRFILTAAHCLSDQRGNRYRNDQVTIKLGGVDLVRHQAPNDILRNGELLVEARQSPVGLAPPRPDGGKGASRRASGPAGDDGRASGGRDHDDEEEEFSWTSFITKALGLGSSSSSSSSGGPTIKSVDKGKQQLAAHAKKTYFKEYRVANIKQHPKFQRHGFYNDIGLIELKSDVDYDDLISPICLPTELDLKRDLSGYMATVLGWGTLSYGGQGSKLLQQVAMPVWKNEDCDARYLQHIGKTFLCAGFLTGGKDACQGDSGGPLMVGDKSGRWTLHGVVSFGKTCAQANYPGVYTRVTEYLDWIRDNTDLGGYTGSSSSARQQQQLHLQAAPVSS